MLLLTPYVDMATLTDDDVAEANGLDPQQVFDLFDKIYEHASDGNATLSVRGALGEDGALYKDLQLKVVGSFVREDKRWCLCEGGMAVNIDVLSDMLSELIAEAERRAASNE